MRLVCEKCVVSSSLRSFKKEDLLNFKIVEVENQKKQHELAVFYIIQKAFILPIVSFIHFYKLYSLKYVIPKLHNKPLDRLRY